MIRSGYLFLFIFIMTGCSQQPRMTAWDHLYAALEQDESSVLEYIALEHLPEIIAYDLTASLRETIHADPEAAVDWILDNYRERLIPAIAAEIPADIIPNLVQRHGDRLLDHLYIQNPGLITEIAVRYDPYLAFEKAYQADPAGILRRAIDRDPRYAAQYMRNYYNGY